MVDMLNMCRCKSGMHFSRQRFLYAYTTHAIITTENVRVRLRFGQRGDA